MGDHDDGSATDHDAGGDLPAQIAGAAADVRDVIKMLGSEFTPDGGKRRTLTNVAEALDEVANRLAPASEAAPEDGDDDEAEAKPATDQIVRSAEGLAYSCGLCGFHVPGLVMPDLLALMEEHRPVCSARPHCETCSCTPTALIVERIAERRERGQGTAEGATEDGEEPSDEVYRDAAVGRVLRARLAELGIPHTDGWSNVALDRLERHAAATPREQGTAQATAEQHRAGIVNALRSITEVRAPGTPDAVFVLDGYEGDAGLWTPEELGECLAATPREQGTVEAATEGGDDPLVAAFMGAECVRAFYRGSHPHWLTPGRRSAERMAAVARSALAATPREQGTAEAATEGGCVCPEDVCLGESVPHGGPVTCWPCAGQDPEADCLAAAPASPEAATEGGGVNLRDPLALLDSLVARVEDGTTTIDLAFATRLALARQALAATPREQGTAEAATEGDARARAVRADELRGGASTSAAAARRFVDRWRELGRGDSLLVVDLGDGVGQALTNHHLDRLITAATTPDTSSSQAQGSAAVGAPLVALSEHDAQIVRAALEGASVRCRFHGDDFGRSGWERGEPRCESCQQPYRVQRARNLLGLAKRHRCHPPEVVSGAEAAAVEPRFETREDQRFRHVGGGTVRVRSGDGQRVEFDLYDDGGVELDDDEARDLGRTLLAAADSPIVEKPTPPLAVGDPIETDADLDRLPIGTLIRGADKAVAERVSSAEGWTLVGLDRPPNLPLMLPARVLDLPAAGS